MIRRAVARLGRHILAGPLLTLALFGAAAFEPAPAALRVREADGRWSRWNWTEGATHAAVRASPGHSATA